MKKKIIITFVVAFILGFLSSNLINNNIQKSAEAKGKDINSISDQEFTSIIKRLFNFLNIMKTEMESFDNKK
jgi:hypothetical protein